MVTSLQVGNPRLTDLVPRLRDLNVIRVKEKKGKKKKTRREISRHTTLKFYARLIYRSPKGIFKMTAIYIEEKIKSIIFNTLM